MNYAMHEKVKTGECIDVAKIGKPFAPGVWELTFFVEDVDYAYVPDEQWIWSIGRRKCDGKIYAALDARYYQCRGYECLWLR